MPRYVSTAFGAGPRRWDVVFKYSSTFVTGDSSGKKTMKSAGFEVQYKLRDTTSWDEVIGAMVERITLETGITHAPADIRLFCEGPGDEWTRDTQSADEGRHWAHFLESRSASLSEPTLVHVATRRRVFVTVDTSESESRTSATASAVSVYADHSSVADAKEEAIDFWAFDPRSDLAILICEAYNRRRRLRSERLMVPSQLRLQSDTGRRYAEWNANDAIHLSHLRLLKPLDSVFQIEVETCTGKLIALEVSTEQSVSDVMAMIVFKEGIPRVHQCLVYAGQKLECGRTLWDYFIEESAKLQLVLK